MCVRHRCVRHLPAPLTHYSLLTTSQVLDIELGLGTNNNNNLDSLDDLDLELGWGNQAGFVKPQLEQGDYSPKSVVPSEPSFAPEQTKAQLGEGMGNGMYLEADGSFGYSLTSS